MKKLSSNRMAINTGLLLLPYVLLFFILVLCSFSNARLVDDFLKQLGISKTGADEKITGGFLGGGLDMYGIKNAKNIALGDRKAVALEVLAYVKKHVANTAFVKQYNVMREGYKPKETTSHTPEQLKANDIALAKKGIADIKATVKKADANNKPIFEKVLVQAQKNLKTVEDPMNKHHVAYTKNYEGLVKSMKENYRRQLVDWEKKYPANQLLYVKVRLQEFMEATKDIDFGAELTTKNGIRYFVNRNYERKDNRWKMAFRAGKEVIEPAREAVQKWIDEIKATENQPGSNISYLGNG